VNFQPGEPPQLDEEALLAGGESISVIQPEFSPDGHYLAYVSDQTGWWQIHIYNIESGEHRQLTHTEAEHAIPPWLQEQSSYGFSRDSQRIYFLRNKNGISSLWQLDLESGEESQIWIEGDYTWLKGLAVSRQKDQIALIASRGDTPHRLITVTPDGQNSVIHCSNANHLSRDTFSLPQPISWPSEEGVSIHGLFYPPHNPIYKDKGLPPLLVVIHSGPTRQKWAEFQPRVQYFTSRGYAVLEVNYRGSTGYGRAYREYLKGTWGVLDVADCLSGARFVTDQSWANPDKMVLFGSSSGGLTVLQTLIAHPGIFRAGITLYGITNHITLRENPPKFERYYSDWLIGPYPEAADLFRSRSPLFSVDKIQDPVAVFQGGKDPIVPADQSEQIISALQKNGIPCEYHLYPEEGHGFKRFDNIQDFYQKVDAFLKKYVI
jgi:dipeptidyl aminopeptidase/acylaminoacyl peptidase